jgi:hypothetical protein
MFRVSIALSKFRAILLIASEDWLCSTILPPIKINF